MAFKAKDRQYLSTVTPRLEIMADELLELHKRLASIQKYEENMTPMDPTGDIHAEQSFAIEVANREVFAAYNRIRDTLETLYDAIR